ncbi:hypothetical protein DPMN_151226 [Dreissena polymorpha]|uniref:Uncharacterized protein n=1 Tax=Dreissena polymorpha TaxID=45954 RepID=A0A9D4FKS5_DREPO|nr:hypothetical protein DPMN_151226 [Dreissena polymorpha]
MNPYTETTYIVIHTNVHRLHATINALPRVPLREYVRFARRANVRSADRQATDSMLINLIRINAPTATTLMFNMNVLAIPFHNITT